LVTVPVDAGPALEPVSALAEPPQPLSHLGRPDPSRPPARPRHPHIRDVGVFGLFVALFAMALRPVVDNDLFWHLATGRYIWATGRVPHADPFSWTEPGRAWIAHEWLTETFLYPLYAHGGYPALMLVFASVITAAFAVAYATARLLGAARPIAALVIGLAALASDHTWGVRPQMLSLLLTASTLWVLTRAMVTGRARALWVLPALLALWANLHGGFIFGLVIIGLVALGQTGEEIFDPPPSVEARDCPPGHAWARMADRWGRGAESNRPQPAVFAMRPQAQAQAQAQAQVQAQAQAVVGQGVRARTLWAVFAASLAACLANPNGLKGLIYPFTYLGDNASTRYIAEWVSPDFHQGQYQLFEALALALIAGVAFSPRRPRVTEALLALLFTHLALVSVRNINLFSIVVAPLVAVYLSHAWGALSARARARARALGEGRRGAAPAAPADRRGEERLLAADQGTASYRPSSLARRPVTRGIAALNLTLAAVIAGAMLVISAPNLGTRRNTRIQAQRFPAGAVSYLRAHRLHGPLLNSYDWGGYLIWTLYPRERVYVDGRPDMYGDRFVDAFVRTWRAEPGWQATLRRQGVRLVLVEPSSGLGRALAGAPGWRAMYRDKVSVLYARA